METLAIGFVGAWLGVACYVGRLSAEQRRLKERLEAAEARAAEETEAEETPVRRAA